MNRIGALLIAGAVVVVVVVGGILVLRSTGSSAAGPKTMSVRVAGSSMTPDKLSAKQNQQLTIHVTADKEEEIHLHGYDIHFEVGGAGQTVTHSFKADKTGNFNFEIEDSSTPLGDLTVTP
jgi:FtsP/CotA-like multicopper oxidase with cupredoxin domain